MNQPPWLSTLPDGWRALPLRHVASVQNSNVDKKSYDDGIPVRLCNYTDVYYNEYITPDLHLQEATATAKEVARFELRAGDVIITKDSESWNDIGVPACVSEEMPGVVCGYHLTMLRPFPEVDGRYLLRALQADGVRDQFWLAANGVTRFGLGQQGMKGALIPTPPLFTQRAIADFLDRKTAAIDALIEKKERLLALLAEKRAALIHQAVTKGLDPNVPMKDSGVPWIGEIPAHWEVMQLRRQVTLQRGVDITKADQCHGTVPVVSSGGVASYHDTALVKGPGIVVGRKGSAGSVHWIEDDFWPHDTTLYVKWFGENHVRYVYYKLLSMDLASYDTGSANPTVNRNLIHPVHVSWPSKTEQAGIARALDERLRQMTRLATQTGASINKLREYRQALITAAVTGQLDLTAGKQTALSAAPDQPSLFEGAL